jgi:hypothetical protein
MRIHPGGAKILQRVIGTDITNDFFIETSNQPKFTFGEIDSDKNRSTIHYSIIEKYDDKSRFDDSKQKRAIMKRGSIANVFDVLNSSSFKNSRIATHHHSMFATTKLASMVIARLDDGPQKIKQPNVENEHIPHDLRRYILLNKEIVSRSDAQRPVVKLTFQVINSNEQLPEFLPGDYIEILSHIKGQVLLRSYTPLQSSRDKCFSVIIRIYEEGLMSRHLVSIIYLIIFIIMLVGNLSFFFKFQDETISWI